MSLIGELLLIPLTAPVRGFGFLLERLHDEAEAVLFDEGRTFAELIDLSMRHNTGQLSDDDFQVQEAELLARLRSIREYREELEDADADFDEDELLDDEAEFEEENR